MATQVPVQFSKRLKAMLNGPNPPQWLRVLQKKQMIQRQRWTEEGTPFLVGQKKVYLPNFTVQFNRTPALSPRWASFNVPLWFNKLDLRDYLWHLYQVRIHSVRSYVVPSPIQRKPNPIPGKRLNYRPMNKKRMTVELVKPFVWPEEPTLEELDEMFNTTRARREEEARIKYGLGDNKADKEQERQQLRAKAEELLKTKTEASDPYAHKLPTNVPLTLDRVVAHAQR